MQATFPWLVSWIFYNLAIFLNYQTKFWSLRLTEIKISAPILHGGEKLQGNIVNKNTTTFVEMELSSTQLHPFSGSQVKRKFLIHYWQRRAELKSQEILNEPN